ncbi:MAG: NAD-dependent epimerase/dehydratase family protein [Sediminispirochaetaceae bacterium]
MRVLITGGTGFIGMTLAEELTDQGVDVVLLARRPMLPAMEASLEGRKGNYFFHKGDILSGSSLDEAIRKYEIDSIVHAAVITPDEEREKEESHLIAQVNYMGTIEVLEAVKRNGVNRLVYTSSGATYGDASFDDEWLHEEKNYPRPNALYGINKFAGEQAYRRYKKIFGLDIVIGRVGGVFGAWERYTGVRDTLSGPFFATRAAVLGEHPAILRPDSKDWVYSRDIARSLAAMLSAGKFGYDVYNLSSGFIWSGTDWCDKLKEAFPKFDYTIVDDPAAADITDFGMLDRKPMNIDRLKQDLGCVPVYDLDRSFEDYMTWINSNSDFWVNP